MRSVTRNRLEPVMVRLDGDGAVERGKQDCGKGPAPEIEHDGNANVSADHRNSLAPPKYHDEHDHGHDQGQGDDVADVMLEDEDQESLLRSLFDSAAHYLAISTHNPRLPEGHQLPLNRQIAMLRALRGWTQSELATHAEVSQTDVSRAECDNPTAKRTAVERICAVLKIPI